MGITGGNSLTSDLCSKALILQVRETHNQCEVENFQLNPDEKRDVHLYIDGPILIYAGNIKGKTENESVFIVLAKLKKILKLVRQYYKVSKVKIFFDGSAPREKLGRQNKNRQLYNFQNIKAEFLKRLQNTEFFDSIVLLSDGEEAERLIFMSRPEGCLTIGYTKDTDLFGIAYNSENFIFLQELRKGRDRLYKFYDMSKFKYDSLTKETFIMLMAFAGSDYTVSRLSETQIHSILNGFKNNQLENLKSRTIESINTFIDQIDLYMLHYKGRIGVSRQYDSIREAVYLKSILWYISYIA